MSNAADNPRPPNATHVRFFYSTATYYKRVEYQHLNQVSEEWQTRVKWWYWDINQWVDVGPGFSSHNLKKLNTE